MAAPSYALEGVVQNNADSSAGWSGGNVDADSEKQGTACLGLKVSNATSTVTHTGTSRNFSAGQANEGDVVMPWLHCLTPTLDSKANGGFRVQVGTSVWYVGGQDNRKADWGAYPVDPTITPTTGGTITTATVFGGTVKTISNIMGNFNNGLWDQVTIGKGIRQTAGDVATPGDLTGFLVADTGTKNNTWGWMRSDNGIFFYQGQLLFGDGTTVGRTEISGETLVFEDNDFVQDGFYRFHVAANHTQITESAQIIAANSGKGFRIIVDGTWTGTGDTIDGYSVQADLNSGTNLTNPIFKNGTVGINANGSTSAGANVQNSSAAAAIIFDTSSEASSWTGTNYRDNAGHSIEYGEDGVDLTLTNVTFSGGGADDTAQADFNYTGTAAITLNISGGTTPTVNPTSLVTIPPLVSSLTFTGIPNGLEARVKKGSQSIFYVASVTGNNFVYSFSYVAGEKVQVTIGGVADDSQSYERQTLTIDLPSQPSVVPLEFSLNPSYQ